MSYVVFPPPLSLFVLMVNHLAIFHHPEDSFREIHYLLILFLLCVKGFTSLLAKVEMEGQLHGISICRRAPYISNLLFADDSLLFCRANQGKVQVLMDILDLYTSTSGQCINFDKSSIYFSSNTDVRHREWIKNTLGVKEVARFEPYLGLPTLIGRSKYQSFSFLKDKVWKKLQR